MKTKSEQLKVCRTCLRSCFNCKDNEYVNAIQAHLVGIQNLSPISRESYFSKAPCECCKDGLAGDRYDFTGTVFVDSKPKETIKVSCCVDCFGWLFT